MSKFNNTVTNLFNLAVSFVKDVAVLPRTFYEQNIKADSKLLNNAAIGVAGLVAAVPLLASGSLAGVGFVYGMCALSVAAMAAVKRDSTVIGDHLPYSSRRFSPF